MVSKPQRLGLLMTDRYAVNLFETLFIPKPWIGPGLDG